jgi:seryl-tRNA synthetase
MPACRSRKPFAGAAATELPMLDLNYVREHTKEAESALRRRGTGLSLDPFNELDGQRRSLLVEVEALKRNRNETSKKIGQMVKSGGDAEPIKAEMRRVGDRIKELEKTLKKVEDQLQAFMRGLPNLPHETVPVGESEEDNTVVRTWGKKPDFPFEPKAHWDIGVELGILDFERAAKLAGARFALYMGDGARLERALIQFMLDLHVREHGYTEVLPPFMVGPEALVGTGQLPKFEEDLFKVEPGGYYLVPTAEVPLTNIHAGEILDGEALPLQFTAYTPCFRSEAGSYGKDVRGLIRQHQFNKVELVHVTRPDDSYDALERLTVHAEEVLKRLGLHYRAVTLCTGDMGFAAAKTYDLEVWLPGQGAYREISSCSNCTDFQARRAAMRFRPEPKAKPRFVHTLNGSGLAVGRTLVAILEVYQQADQTVLIPEALRPYMDDRERIEPRT